MLGADGCFDEQVARRYDESVADMFEPAAVGAAVDFIAALAGSGRALELGIGAGRLALPLAQRGVAVAGIELSRAMVARLRAKPGGADTDMERAEGLTGRQQPILFTHDREALAWAQIRLDVSSGQDRLEILEALAAAA